MKDHRIHASEEIEREPERCAACGEHFKNCICPPYTTPMLILAGVAIIVLVLLVVAVFIR